MNATILSIGRHKLYPYFCFLIVIGAFLYTDPFTELNLRYAISFFGAITGLICVILFTRRNQLGNYFGLLATFGESMGNFLGGNIGAGLPHVYNFATHIYGIFNWRKNHDNSDKVVTRSLSFRQHIYVLIAFIAIFTLNIIITTLSGIENTTWQLVFNSCIFGLAIPAQTLLVMRYDFNWYLWIIMNVFAISLNFFGPNPNPIIGVQYCIYLFNSLYGLIEWKTFANNHPSHSTQSI